MKLLDQAWLIAQLLMSKWSPQPLWHCSLTCVFSKTSLPDPKIQSSSLEYGQQHLLWQFDSLTPLAQTFQNSVSPGILNPTNNRISILFIQNNREAGEKGGVRRFRARLGMGVQVSQRNTTDLLGPVSLFPYTLVLFKSVLSALFLHGSCSGVPSGLLLDICACIFLCCSVDLHYWVSPLPMFLHLSNRLASSYRPLIPTFNDS